MRNDTSLYEDLTCVHSLHHKPGRLLPETSLKRGAHGRRLGGSGGFPQKILKFRVDFLVSEAIPWHLEAVSWRLEFVKIVRIPILIVITSWCHYSILMTWCHFPILVMIIMMIVRCVWAEPWWSSSEMESSRVVSIVLLMLGVCLGLELVDVTSKTLPMWRVRSSQHITWHQIGPILESHSNERQIFTE